MLSYFLNNNASLQPEVVEADPKPPYSYASLIRLAISNSPTHKVGAELP